MKKYFNKIMDIGELMLVCGAEVHRVEDTIERILQSFEMTAERAMNYVQKYWK